MIQPKLLLVLLLGSCLSGKKHGKILCVSSIEILFENHAEKKTINKVNKFNYM